jgi:FkbM family methyltransferase
MQKVCNMQDTKSYSQNNEQEIILNYIERKQLASGKLLDIGAYDGETFSNVRYLMLKYPGWKGVFVEPSSYCFSKLVDMYKMEPRRAELINLAVVPETQLSRSPILKFFESPMSACSSSVEGHVQRWVGEKNSDGDFVNPRKIYVGQIGMKEILDTFGPFELINIDVEGYSASLALQDWFYPNNYGCQLICIEQDGKYKELQQKFAASGYSMLGLNAENIIMGIL